MNNKITPPRYEPYLIVGSLQAHAAKMLVADGVCPCIGTTDLGLPKLIVYEQKNSENSP